MVVCNNNYNNNNNRIQNGLFVYFIYGIFTINICLNVDIYNNKNKNTRL